MSAASLPYYNSSPIVSILWLSYLKTAVVVMILVVFRTMEVILAASLALDPHKGQALIDVISFCN
jgi:hypothetical protein